MKVIMKNFNCRESRPCKWSGVHCLGTLLSRPASHLLSCLLIVVAGALLAVGCQKPGLPVEEKAEIIKVVDSTNVKVSLGSQYAMKCLDLFFFEKTGINALTYHERVYPEKTGTTLFELRVPSTSAHVVAIANACREFNLKAITRYDVLQKFEYDFTDDSSDYPLLSEEADISEGLAQMALTPLMCTVELVKISNLMEEYELVEDPKIRLGEMNMSANVLQKYEFHPSAVLEKGEWEALPCDIGYYPSEPGTKLHCYPNDTPENTLGSHTLFEMECVIKGEKCTYSFELPPFGRASHIDVSIVVEEAGVYTHRLNVRDQS